MKTVQLHCKLRHHRYTEDEHSETLKLKRVQRHYKLRHYQQACTTNNGNTATLQVKYKPCDLSYPISSSMDVLGSLATAFVCLVERVVWCTLKNFPQIAFLHLCQQSVGKNLGLRERG